MQMLPDVPTSPVRLVPMQRLGSGGRWRTEAMRSYRMPVLLWFTRGQGRITVAGLTRGYGPNNAIFIPPGTMHGFEVSPQVFGTAVFFNDSDELDLPRDHCHLRVRETQTQGEMNTMIETLRRELDGNREHRDRALTHHIGLLTVWIERQRAVCEDRPRDCTERGLARRFTEAVEERLFSGQTIGDYAASLGVTPADLARVCTETCGRPASDLLADRLTFEARRLLLDTSLPVGRVAEVLGYASPAYFTQEFHTHTGETPLEFRERRAV